MLTAVFLLVMVVCGPATVGYTRVDGSDMARDGSESTIDGSDHKNNSRSTAESAHPAVVNQKIPIHKRMGIIIAHVISLTVQKSYQLQHQLFLYF